MANRNDTVWQSAEQSQRFLTGIRAGIPLADEQIDIMLRVTAKAQPNPSTVLDLGCGDGVLGRALHSLFPQAHYCFADFSKPMLKAAREALSPSDTVHYVAVDFASSNWVERVKPYHPFDVIVSGYAIHHAPDDRKRAVYSEIFDLLSSCGVFVHAEHVAPASLFIAHLHEDYFVASLYEQKRKTNPGLTLQEVDAQYRKHGDSLANKLTPLETQLAWLREAGFMDVDTYLKVFELALFGGIKPSN